MAQAITLNTQSTTALVNRQNFQMENPPVHNMANMLSDFTMMNPPIFTGSKTSKDPQEFMDEVNKIHVAMGTIDTEKDKIASYKLNDVAQTQCNMWKDSPFFGGVLVISELFKTTFLKRLFTRETREAKVDEFINLYP